MRSSIDKTSPSVRAAGRRRRRLTLLAVLAIAALSMLIATASAQQIELQVDECSDDSPNCSRSQQIEVQEAPALERRLARPADHAVPELQPSATHSASTSLTTTAAPARARSLAYARPSPRPLPVTTATFPVRSTGSTPSTVGGAALGRSPDGARGEVTQFCDARQRHE